MSFSTDDWAVFTHPGHGGPIMPSGTGVPSDSDKKHRRARKTFFREAWCQKINPTLQELDNLEEQIEYLLFVRYDATENQILTWTEEAETFLSNVDKKLRELYRAHFENVFEKVSGDPPERQIASLKAFLLTERQRPHSDASPSFNHLSSLIEDEIEKIRLQNQTEKRPGAETQEITSEQGEQESPITGYRGAEYAIEAKQVLDNKSTITTFSALEKELEEPTVGGGSKVDTVKRNIGYNDLPKEEKEFSQFRKLLKKKVKQLKGEA